MNKHVIIDSLVAIDELDTLQELARTADGCIVEIGSYKGSSTITLAKGSLEGKNAVVYSIDNFKGNTEFEEYRKDFYSTFLYNVIYTGSSGAVFPIVMDSVEASKLFQCNVGLIFIDGNHSYKGVKGDYNAWFPKISVNGIIAIHDTLPRDDFDGPFRLKDELLKDNKVKFIEQVNSMAIFKKVKE